MSEKFVIEGLPTLREPTSVSFKKSDITSSERTMSGNLVVDYIATKNTVSVSWSVLTDAEFKSLMAFIDSKRGNNAFFTINTVMPGYSSSDDPADSGSDSAGSGNDTSHDAENASYAAEGGSGAEELDLTENTVRDANNAAQTSSAPAVGSPGKMTVYAEEISYYPYFMSDGSVVWRDVSIEFSEV